MLAIVIGFVVHFFLHIGWTALLVLLVRRMR